MLNRFFLKNTAVNFRPCVRDSYHSEKGFQFSEQHSLAVISLVKIVAVCDLLLN